MHDRAFEQAFTSCGLKFTPTSFVIEAPDKSVAIALKSDKQLMATQAQRFKLADTQIFYPGCSRPFIIPAAMAPDLTQSTSHILNSLGVLDAQLDLLGADYIRILDLLKQCHEEGLIVILTSNTTDICLHTSPTLTPARAYWNASRFHGYNYLNSWRRDRHFPPNPEQLNPQYYDLKDYLRRDGQARDYEYTLYRPDGALVRYLTSYFLCREYCGDEIRVGISRPADFEIIEPAAEMAIV